MFVIMVVDCRDEDEELSGLTPEKDTDLTPEDLTPKAEAAGGGLEVSAEVWANFTLEDRVGEVEDVGVAEAVVEVAVTITD